jgi:predicted transcriptional regulator of viral defense system
MNGRRTHDNSLNDKVIKIMRGSGGKRVFTAKDFSGLGGNVAVRKVLSRLAEKGTIRRIRHGVYDYPRYSKLLGTWVAPDPDAIARAIAREYGWTITPAGEAALNLLGLSEQVPSQWRYVSNGPTRKYEWAGGTISASG